MGYQLTNLPIFFLTYLSFHQVTGISIILEKQVKVEKAIVKENIISD